MSSNRVISIIILILLLFGLPPLGIALSGRTLPPHLTILPVPTQPGNASLSWPIVGMLALLISVTLAPFLLRYGKTQRHGTSQPVLTERFPWWGWMAAGWTTLAWILSWTRFPWFHEWQSHTFQLLWFGYIVVINALLYSRTGQCLLIHHPAYLSKLFLLSAGFWWMFEYLNQFVHNWHYVGMIPGHPVVSFFWTTIAFSTVLPAIVGTYEYLSSFPQLKASFENWQAISLVDSPGTGWLMFILGCFGLIMIGIWPTLLFSLLWVSPLLIILGIKTIQNVPTILTPLAKGNWSPVVLSALAALVCGWFWEMWNANSLVHWEYSIPYVHAIKIFEMPVLGYAGYLPFGLECLAVVDFFLGNRNGRIETCEGTSRTRPSFHLAPKGFL